MMNVLEGWLKRQTTASGQQREEVKQLEISKVVVGLGINQASQYSKNEGGEDTLCTVRGGLEAFISNEMKILQTQGKALGRAKEQWKEKQE